MSSNIRRICALFFVVTGCGGLAADGPKSDSDERYCPPGADMDPGQSDRIDGSVCNDGVFNTPEDKQRYCESHPEAWFCADVGQTAEAWTSAEYHGIDAVNSVCYGPASSNGDCIFPQQKQYRVKVTTAGCFTGPPPPDGPSTLQEQNMLDALRNGAKAWNGAGGMVVVDDGTPGSSGYTLITVSCGGCPGGTCAAEGGNSGTVTTRVSNLPVGPHGEDQARARTYNSTASAVIRLNTANMWAGIVSRCSSGGITNGEIVGRTTIAGMHEGGHVFGYGHFLSGNSSTNIMFPNAPSTCSPAASIQQVFKDGLAAFDPSSSGTTVSDVNLETLSPE